MRRFLVFLAAFFAGALAQGSTYAYRAEDLTTRPGLILVSPGYTTLLELFAPVEEQFSGNGNLLDIKNSGNLVVLFAKAKSGETDLILRAKGYTLLFRVKVVEGGEPRRYIVQEGRPTIPYGEGEVSLMPGATRLQKEGLALAGQARVVEGNLEVLLEIRSGSLGLTRILLERAEARGPKGSTTFTITRQGKDVLSPLEAVLLRAVVPGQSRATLTIPVQVNGRNVNIVVTASPRSQQWEGVSLEVNN